MNVWPLRFRKLDEQRLLFADEAGGFFTANEPFLERYARGSLSDTDQEFLKQNGHAFDKENDLAFTSFAYRWTQRQARPQRLSYVVVVPTLRCNLSCTYCQVARADENAAGYDWSEITLREVFTYLDALDTDCIKIEFQGGEPLLRLDLLERLRAFCRQRFDRANFVVCTNLQRVSESHWEFLDADDTSVSTSLDGDIDTHSRHRTHVPASTDEFFANLDYALKRLGPDRVSALPTIDVDAPPAPSALVDAYVRFGFRSIYLRPVNYQGFARKMRGTIGSGEAWNAYHRSFIEHLIERNSSAPTGSCVEEFYFVHCLRRIFQAGIDGHVDLRNPSPVAADYIVIDHDGTLYPSDEARMLARVNRVDLSLGHVSRGIDTSRAAQLNINALNNYDPDCIHCPYQPYCGVDPVDDLSRYGRVDVPRQDTWFCGRQTAIFDLAFRLLYSEDEKVRRSLATWLGIAQLDHSLTARLT
jgi:His-Xaa-Ser system radical SAM maturase HxsB